jgi:heme-degrading monooxygenase HmoA
MVAVIFEVKPKNEGKEEYMKIAAGLRSFLENRDGFMSIERYQSLSEEGKILSLLFWQDEAAIENSLTFWNIELPRKRGGNLCFISTESVERKL